MKMKIARTTWAGGVLTAGAGVAFVLFLAATSAFAQQSGSQARTVEGTWYVQVTPRNCDTGAQIAPVVNSLVTFAQGGTMNESAGGGAFAPGQRSGGHGTWTHAGGHTFTQRFVALILFTTPPTAFGPGFEAGWQTVEHTVEVIDADHIASAGTNSFYRSTGEVYRTGCSTATGRRFQ